MTIRRAAVAAANKRAVIYCRISQDREGRAAGVERQEADCRALAARLGYVIVEIYCDNDLSASTRSKKIRPRYRQMLADGKAGHFAVVLAYTSGRVTRKPREHEDLIELAEQHHIHFQYVNSPSFDLNTSAGRRIARMLAANDAGEAEDTQERVMREKQQVAENGDWKGGRRPFGYEDDGMTVRRPEADEALRASREVVAGASLRSLAAGLNRRGVTTSTGAAWTTRALSRVLTRPRNAGLMEHQGEIIGKANWPAIVPEPMWRRVAAILADPARRTQMTSVARWMGSGLYLCHCGAKVRVHGSGGKRTGAHPAYTCTVTKHMTRIAHEVDDLVTDVVIERLSRPDAVQLVAADAGEDPTDAMERANDLRGELDDLAAAHGRDEITLPQLTTASAPKRKQLLQLEQRIAVAGRTSVLAGLVGQQDVKAAWDALDLDRKRAVIHRLVTVELLASNKGRRKGWKPGESYFDPDTVAFHWKD